jgi:hypothetical protein
MRGSEAGTKALLLVCHSRRNAADARTWPMGPVICRALTFIANVVNLVVSIMTAMAGTINAMGWSTVLIYLCGAVRAGYFLTAGKVQQRAA